VSIAQRVNPYKFGNKQQETAHSTAWVCSLSAQYRGYTHRFVYIIYTHLCRKQHYRPVADPGEGVRGTRNNGAAESGVHYTGAAVICLFFLVFARDEATQRCTSRLECNSLDGLFGKGVDGIRYCHCLSQVAVIIDKHTGHLYCFVPMLHSRKYCTGTGLVCGRDGSCVWCGSYGWLLFSCTFWPEILAAFSNSMSLRFGNTKCCFCKCRLSASLDCRCKQKH